LDVPKCWTSLQICSDARQRLSRDAPGRQR
jgi:hypothetical protein